MNKRTYFASQVQQGWPTPAQIEHYFLAPPEQRWFFDTGNDGASFTAEGVENTHNLPADKGRVDIELMLWGHRTAGVLLIWSKWGGGYEQAYTSKGDITRLGEFVRTLHNDPRPVGLFVPYEAAWKAVKEFLETDGVLPRSIEWIANKDLPPNAFPDP